MTRKLGIVPLMTTWEWQFEGRCRERSAAMFFHPDGERGVARELRIMAAKEVCASCPVIWQCREHAFNAPETYGVWGGMSEEEHLAHRDIPAAS